MMVTWFHHYLGVFHKEGVARAQHYHMLVARYVHYSLEDSVLS